MSFGYRVTGFGTNVGDQLASGGTITTDGDYKVHTFNSSGIFTIPRLSNVLNAQVEYLVIAGGGGGGGEIAGGGGAGGYRTATGFSVAAGDYAITVGAGAASKSSSASPDAGDNGSNSVFSSITSIWGWWWR